MSIKKWLYASLALVGLVPVGVLYGILQTPTYVPKPVGHPRLVLPPPAYQPLLGDYPYFFEYSQHAIVQHSGSELAEAYWIDIYYPAFEAVIQLTYKPVKDSPQLLREYCQDASKLTAKHQVRASAIEKRVVQTPQGYRVLVAELRGQVPSQFQFHTLDHPRHFLRGALYFNTASESEYLAPIIAFIKKDILHMLHTLELLKAT